MKKEMNKYTFGLMMIFITFAFIFCFLLFPITANAESIGNAYSSTQHHYSFTIPDEWVAIPKSTINEVKDQVVDTTSLQFNNYTAGFQLENNEVFQYPYILVQQHELKTPSFNQIIATFENNKFSEKANEKIDELKKKELIVNATPQDPFVDKEKNIIFMNMEMETANKEKVKGLTTLFLGKNGITQLNFYSLKSEYTENLSTFNQIINSFKYSQGYEYDKIEARKNDSTGIFEGVIDEGITGFFGGIGLFIVILLIFKVLQVFKEKKHNMHYENCNQKMKNTRKEFFKKIIDWVFELLLCSLILPIILGFFYIVGIIILEGEEFFEKLSQNIFIIMLFLVYIPLVLVFSEKGKRIFDKYKNLYGVTAFIICLIFILCTVFMMWTGCFYFIETLILKIKGDYNFFGKWSFIFYLAIGILIKKYWLNKN